ncbi:hypothetical protein L6452_00569 [Arctium lappa]|uniref:Uncharacterized protein n=1 Tax=Arctium lappa TaxID=4217 RepID=A0ACB9FFJ6_ARCLA|nr:hypothetical protein L6452_00569 [Arctium lappa]
MQITVIIPTVQKGLDKARGDEQQITSSSAPLVKTVMDHDHVRDPIIQGSIGDIVATNDATTKGLDVAAANMETTMKPVEKRGVSVGVTIRSPYMNRKTESMATNKMDRKNGFAHFSANLVASMPKVADIASLKSIDMA